MTSKRVVAPIAAGLSDRDRAGLNSSKTARTVRIDPVSIRTHGPFNNPIVVERLRHFEVTGEDPFDGLVDILAEVARRKRFHVELIPDEKEGWRRKGSASDGGGALCKN